MKDYDPRLVALYDGDNPDGPDHDFYRALATETRAESVLDLGCGTGILTVTLASTPHGDTRRVVGVDPSRAMLRYARERPGGNAVEWVLGTSSAAPSGPFDLAVMSGNVAQHIDAAAWPETLRDLRLRLRDGGTLAFETRNPAARAWAAWTVPATTRTTPLGEIIESSEANEIGPGVIELISRTQFVDSRDGVVERRVLTFRDLPALERDLAAAGFEVAVAYGDWARTPVADASALLIMVAKAGTRPDQPDGPPERPNDAAGA
ncbi:class I SAM-dependent methyltransferase [Micrococcales bacterium 31B]|nr:class I SAM-dependent methyltransferase [Micrococcales bacterium 31B]